MAQQKPPSAMSSVPSASSLTKASPNAGQKAVKTPLPVPPPKAKSPAKKAMNLASIPFWLGLLVSIMWVGIVVLVVAESGPAHTFGGLPLVNWAIGISAIASPVALIWMVTAYLQRAADIQTVAEPLRRQLSIITGESGIAEARIRRFNQAIREQVDLLKDIQSSSHGDFAAIIDRVQKSRLELEQFEQSSIEQVRDIQEIIRRNMQQVEQLMDDKFTQMRVLDDKLVQSGDGVAKQTDAVRDQIAKLLEDVESRNRQLVEAMERALVDSKKLNDTSRLQESTLVTAAENAADILSGVSSKIDLSVARFLERAGTAREEAERLAGALDAQTRAMEEFSTTLPARVTETEVILRGVADRLYSSEKMAREQAAYLTDKLTQQVDGLESFLDRFTTRFTDIDGTVNQRCLDLDKVADRILGTASDFTTTWEKSVNDLSDRSSDALVRFTVINDETRKNADSITWQLNETTAKYEEAASKIKTLSDSGNTNLSGVTEQIDAQLKQFDALQETSRKMGEEVESRATAAMQNLQYVLERLLAAREATQTVGETLVKDLFKAVDQNEALIGRLNEAVEVGVTTLSAATQTLGREEGEIADRARAAEKVLQDAVTDLHDRAQTAMVGLREQTSSLTTLLAQAQVELDKSDSKIQSFVSRSLPPIHEVMRQVGATTEEGVRSLSQYGDGVQQQLTRLQGFNANIGSMGQDLSRVTVETISTIEQLQNRFATARAAQEETAQQTLTHFADLADRLQREVTGLDGQASEAVSTLQNAAAKVGEQSYQMLQSAENSGAKIQLVTSALQQEAIQIRAVLQKQADELSQDLARAETQFATLGDAIQQRTDAAYSLLDRVAAHYNETTSVAANNLDARTDRLQEVTGQVQSKLESVHASLGQQLSQLSQGSDQLETHATQIAGASNKALQQLTAVNEKLTLTHEAASRNAQQTLTRLDETSTTFMRQSNSLTEAAQNSTTLIQKAGVVFGEQSTTMLEHTRQAEQQMRQLSTLTTTMSDQSAQIRESMELQTQRLVSQLTDALRQMEVSSDKIQQTATTAVASADQVSARFDAVSDNATAKLSSGSHYLDEVATKAEGALGSIGASITQQAASLSVLGDQLVEQQRILSGANESQRQQLVDLFDKLGQAHGQASQVAERTIAKLEDSLNHIQRQLGALSDQSQTAVGNVRAAGDGFAEQSGVLLQNAQQAEQQARTVLSVTAALQDQARHLREALHGEGDRAGDLLGSLISKLTSGGIELRDFTSTTEMSLTSLADSVLQHSQSLNGTMQQISERQHTLTSALDAQRDVMNGLLNRLSLAHVEAADVAERSTARLTDGTQQITRQIETLEAQAQSAIANVQAANSNFADSAQVLGTHAREAEQHVQSMLTSTSTLQEQTRQMRESLQSESEKTNGVLADLMGRLVQSGDQLREMASSTATSIHDLQNGFTTETSEMSGAMLQILERQKVLTAALSEQREVMNGLLGRLTMAQEETAAVAERTVTRLTDSTFSVAQQIDTLETHANAVIASVKSANSGFIEEADTLSRRALEAEEQVKSIQTATAAMADQVLQVRVTLESEAEHQVQAIQAATTSIAEQVRQVHATLHSEAEQQVQAIQSTAAAVSEQVRQAHAVLRSETEQQVQAIQSTTATVSEQVRQAHAVLQSEASQQVEAIQVTTAAVSEQVRQAHAVLQNEASQQVEAIQATTEAVKEKVREAHAVLKTEAEQQVEAIQATSSAVTEQARQVRATLQSESGQANNLITSLLNRLSQGGSQLKDLATATEASIASLQGGIAQQSGELGNIMTQAVERQKQLTDTLSEQRDVMDTLLNRLSTAQDEAASVAERAVVRMTSSAETVTQQIDTLETHAKSVIASVQAANSSFAEEADALSNRAREAEQQVRSIQSTTASMAEQTRQMRETLQGEAERANDLLAGLLGRLSEGGVQIRDLASTTETSIASLQTGLTHQTGEMGNVMQQIVERQKILTAAFTEQRDVMSDLLGRLTTAQGETATTAEQTVARLTDSTQSMMRQIEGFDVQVKTVVGTVEAANSNFAQESNVLSAHAREAEAQARSVMSTTAALQDQAKAMRDTLQSEGERSSNVLSGLLDRLEHSGDQLRKLTTITETSITDLQGGLSQQTDAMSTTMLEILERQKVLSTALSQQREVMDTLLNRLTLAQKETAEVAAQTVERLSDSTLSVTRQIETLDTHAKTVIANVEAANTSLVGGADTLSNRAREAEQQVRAIQSTTVAMAEQTRQLREQLQGEAEQQVREMQTTTASMAEQSRQIRETLQSDAERTSDVLGNLLGRLTQGGVQLRELAGTTETSIASLQSGLTQQSSAMTSTMQQIVERQQVLTAALAEQREVMGVLLGRLTAAQDETATAAERTVGRLSTGAQHIITQLAAIETQAKSTLADIEATGKSFIEESESFSSYAQKAEQQALSVQTTTVAMAEQTRQLRETLQNEGQRASETLSGMLSKLAQGTGQIRDVASISETSLGTLNQGLGKQTAEINAAMLQIVERQKLLTSALNEQRDMMGSLLSSVTQAQDQTAAATERTVIRLSDGAQEIVKQLEAIGSAAQSTLGEVQTAGRGFAEEATTLGREAQKAEQNMRNALVVMGGLQGQAQTLRESMQTETERVIGEMKGVIVQLDSTYMQMKQQSTDAVQGIDQSALLLATLAKNSAEAIQKQAEILNETAQSSEGRLEIAGEKIKSHLRIVTDVGAQTEVQARQLADVAEFAHNRLDALRGTILDSDRDGQTTLQQATSRIETVKSALQGEIDRLSNLARDAVGEVVSASRQLATQSDILRANLSSSESALVDAATLIREESTQVPATLHRNTTQIEAAVRILREKATEADTTLVGTADRFIQVTTTARESLLEEMRRIGTVAEDSSAILRHFTAALANEVSTIQASTETLSKERRDLVEKSGQSVAQLGATSERLMKLCADTTVSAEKLAQDFDTIDQRANVTSQRLEQVSVNTSKTVEAMTDVAERAEAQVLTVSSNFRDQLERIRTGLQGQIDDINRGLTQITTQLERTGNTLRSTTAGSVADVERISQRFNETSKEASTQLDTRTTHMRSATEEVAKLLSGFGDQLDVLLDRLSMAGDGIKRHEGSLVSQMQSALTHLSSVAERLETGRTLAANVSDQAVNRLTEVVQAIHSQMQELSAGSQTAAGIMRGIGQIYGDQTQKLNSNVSDAHDQVQAMNAAIDEMQQRTDRIRVSLKLQSDELMEALQQILSQLATTGDALGERVDQVLQERAEEGLKKIS